MFSPSSQSILTELHGDAFRFLCAITESSHEGLTIAARCAKRQGLISGKTAKLMERTDITLHVNQHINHYKGRGYLADLYKEYDDFMANSAANAEKENFAAENNTGDAFQHTIAEGTGYVPGPNTTVDRPRLETAKEDNEDEAVEEFEVRGYVGTPRRRSVIIAQSGATELVGESREGSAGA